MGCWDSVERPKPTKEQIDKFLQRAKSVGLMPKIESKKPKETPQVVLVDYLSLMK